MAEKVHYSSDLPDFDSYPASPSSNEPQNLLEERGVTDWPGFGATRRGIRDRRGEGGGYGAASP